jgi:O-antigen/teichoic acid export membrane protein
VDPTLPDESSTGSATPEPVGEAGSGGSSLAGGSALLFGAQIATNLGYFVAVLFFARGLEVSARGTLAFLTITALVVSRLASLGIGDATTVFAARNPGQRSTLFSNLIAFVTVSMLGAAGLVCALILVTGIHPAGLEYSQLLPLSLAILASGLVDAGYAFLLGLGRISELATLSAIGPWIYASLVAVTSIWLGLTATRAMVAWAIGHALWATILLAGSLRHTRPAAADRVLLRSTLVFGLRAWVGGLSRFLNFRLDQILMGFLATEAALGIYAVSVNASEVLLILPGSAAAATIPLLARAQRHDRLERTLRILRSVTLVTTGTVVVAMAAGPPLITLVFGDRYEGAITPFLVLVPGAIFYTVMAIGSGSLVADSAPGRSSVGPVAALVGGLVLDVILIPPYGATGAAVASTAGFACGAVASLFALRSRWTFPWSSLTPARSDVQALLALAPRGLVRARGRRL